MLGTLKAIEDTRGWKSVYDDAYLNQDYSGFRYVAIEFDEILPFAVCGGVMPEYSFIGEPLQFVGRFSREMEHIAFNVTVIGGRTMAVLGWLGPEQGFARQFAKSLAGLPREEIADALLRFAFEHVENLFLTPSWWNSLPEKTRTSYVKRLKNGTISGDRYSDCLKPDGRRLFSAKPVKLETNYGD